MVWQRLTLVRTVGLRRLGQLAANRTLPGDGQGELRERVADVFADNDRAAYLASMNAIVSWSVVERLDQITSPVLVVASEFDYTPVASKKPIVDDTQDARLVVVEGARHLLPIERPDEFNEILMSFLAEC